MKNVFNFSSGKFYLGDCLKIMNIIPDKSIDMILCDLPYEVTQNKWDLMIPLKELWEQYWRISKKNAAIVLTAIQPFTSILIMGEIKNFKYNWVWKKGNKPTGFLNAKKQPLRITEDVLVFYKKQCIYNPIMVKGAKCHSVGKAKNTTNVKTDNYGKYVSVNTDGNNKYPQTLIDIARDKNKLHSTQKPVTLFEYLIRTYTNENDCVLDNCAGSGTTAIAAINTNRKWICIEKENECFNKANKRIYEHIQNNCNNDKIKLINKYLYIKSILY